MKTIEFTRKSTPTSPAIGYGDAVKVYDGMDVIYEGPGSTCPNPFRPRDKEPWEKVYAMISPGTYEGRVMNHERFGKCILLENGNAIETVNPNFNHNGRYVAYGIFIHVGGKGSKDQGWRGSKACLTVPTKEFFRMFKDREAVAVVITTEERSA